MSANQEIQILSFSNRTVSGDYLSADLKNAFHRGVRVFTNVTTASGSATVTTTIQGKDSLSGSYYDILASTAASAAATQKLTVYPAATAAANAAVSEPLPAVWRVKVTIAGTAGASATVGGCLLV